MITEFNALNGKPYDPETQIFISDAFGNAIAIDANGIDAWILWTENVERIRRSWPNNVVCQGLRLGQQLTNVLSRNYNRNDLNRLVLETELDPFYQDSNIDNYLQFIDENWTR